MVLYVPENPFRPDKNNPGLLGYYAESGLRRIPQT